MNRRMELATDNGECDTDEGGLTDFEVYRQPNHGLLNLLGRFI